MIFAVLDVWDYHVILTLSFKLLSFFYIYSSKGAGASYWLDGEAGFFWRVVKINVNECNLYTLVVATLKDVADSDTLWVSLRIAGRHECAIPCLTAAEYMYFAAACITLQQSQAAR